MPPVSHLSSPRAAPAAMLQILHPSKATKVAPEEPCGARGALPGVGVRVSEPGAPGSAEGSVPLQLGSLGSRRTPRCRRRETAGGAALPHPPALPGSAAPGPCPAGAPVRERGAQTGPGSGAWVAHPNRSAGGGCVGAAAPWGPLRAARGGGWALFTCGGCCPGGLASR